MKSTYLSIGMFTVTLTIAALAGCTTGQDAQHKRHHPAAASSWTPDATSRNDQMQMNMMAMCDKHRKMMSANRPEERIAMMDERMKSMSPEMMQKHMDMMQEKCK